MSEKEINDIISKNLTYYLERKNKTQLELAEYMGVSQATVSNWCKGIKLPRMKKIDTICDYLGIKRSELIEERKEVVNKTITLRPDEKSLLDNYNKLTDVARKEASGYIEYLGTKEENLRKKESLSNSTAG